MMYYEVVFELLKNILSSTLCNPIHDINIPLSFVLLNLESVERKQKNKRNLNIYLENEKSFLDETKSIFYSF